MRRTYLSEFLTIWGLFIFIALSYLGLRLWHFPWREAVTDWGRWVGGFGRLGPQEAARPPAPLPAPAPRSPAPDLTSPGLPAEPSYSAALPSTNGHGEEDTTAAPEPAQHPLPLPALGFTAGFEPLDTIPGDAELAPGLHAATAQRQDAAPPNGPDDDGADDYVLSDTGALGLPLDDEEVRRYSARARRGGTPAVATHDETNGFAPDADGHDNGTAPEAEATAPPRRAVPLERPDREPTYTMRVPPDALAADTGDAEEPDDAEAPAEYTNDELIHDEPPLAAAAVLGADALSPEPLPLVGPEPVADVAAGEPLPVAAAIAEDAPVADEAAGEPLPVVADEAISEPVADEEWAGAPCGRCCRGNACAGSR